MNNIPKICHMYWDRSPMAFLNTVTVSSFKRMNPDWRIVLYLTKQDYTQIGKNTFVPDYTGKDYFHLIRDLVEIREVDLVELGLSHLCAIQSSDIVRLKYLYDQGGVWSDMDVVWLKPMSDLAALSDDFEATICYYKHTHGFHAQSIMIAEQKSKFIYSLIEKQHTVDPSDHQAYGTKMMNEMYPTLDSAMAKYPRLLAIPYKLFYPYSTYHMEELFINTNLKPVTDAMAIHWFNGNKISKDYINKKAYARDCSMTYILNSLNYSL